MTGLKSRTRWILGFFLGICFIALLVSMVLGFRYPQDRGWDLISTVTAGAVLAGTYVLHRG